MVLGEASMVSPPPPRRMNELLWDMLCLVCKKYKKQILAVLFVLLEAISVLLEIFGKNTVGSVLASFFLSVFGAAVTLYTTFVMEERIRNIQLVVVEIVFSFVQLIVTYVDLTMKFLHIERNYKVSLSPLAFAIIALVFAFKNNPVDSPNERPPALEREPPTPWSASSLLTLLLQREPLFVNSGSEMNYERELLLLHRRFLQYVLQKITKVCDLVSKYKIHMLAVVLVLDAISSGAPDQLSGESKRSFVLATSPLILPVFGFACIKGRNERQLIGVVVVVFAMFQLIITTMVHFTLTISGATNSYNAPWFPLAFAAIVVIDFKAIPMPDSGIVQRYIDLAELNSYEDLYRKVKQMYDIEGPLVGSERKWELNYIDIWHEWRVVGSDEAWGFFCWRAKVMIIRRR